MAVIYPEPALAAGMTDGGPAPGGAARRGRRQ